MERQERNSYEEESPRGQAPEGGQTNDVYVGNLPESATEAELRELFQSYGKIE